MKSDEIVKELKFAQQALNERRSWFDFVSRIDHLLEGLRLLEPEQGDMERAADDLNTTLREEWRELAGQDIGLLLAEVYGLCQTRGALAAGMDVLQTLWGRELEDGRLREQAWQGRSVARAYLASLALIDGLFPSDEFGRLLLDAAQAGRNRYQWSDDARRVLQSMWTVRAARGAPPVATANLLANHVPHPDLPGLRPGDCLFRDLNVLGLKDLGHVGIYLGCPASRWADRYDWKEHWVIEMSTRNCEKNTVVDFKSHGNFWGFYSAKLADVQRDALLNLAASFLGTCTYARFSNYKNVRGLQFRCDGFVEYCHETVGVAPPLPSHRRGGLFEDDSWRTLTPSAMRNCFADKFI